MSNALAIETMEGAHVGFLITHFDSDTAQPGTHRGECIFIALPTDREVLNHPLLDLLYAHKFAREHRCVLTVASDRRKYNIQHDRLGPLQILLRDGAGQLIDLDTSAIVGKIVAVAPGSEPAALPSLE